MNTSTIKVIEQDNVTRVYDFIGTEAIIDHSEHGRLLIVDEFGYGGEGSMSGGAVRWEHGSVAKIKDTDTLALLHQSRWNDSRLSLMEAITSGYDDERPLHDWSGWAVQAVAAKAGL